MKTIAEMQEALDSFYVATTAQLAEISANLDAYEVTKQTTPPDILKQIDIRASNHPIINKGLKASGSKARQAYMRFLSAIASDNEDKLLFVQRIGAGSGSKWSTDRLIAEGMAVSEQFIEEAAIHLKSLCHPLLLDCLVTANISGTATKRDMEMIADIAGILKCEESDLIVISQLAAAVVQMDERLFCELVCDKVYPGLSHLIPQEWMECIPVGRFSIDEHTMCIESGYVQKGQVIFKKTSKSTSKLSASLGSIALIPGITKIPVIVAASAFAIAATATKVYGRSHKANGTAPINGIVAYVPRNPSAINPRAYDIFVINPFYDEDSFQQELKSSAKNK